METLKILFVVNDIGQLKPQQTTALLIRGAAERDHAVFVCDVGDFSLAPDGPRAFAAPVIIGADDTPDMLSLLRAQEREQLDLSSLDVMLLRTNPARDESARWAHDTMLDFARVAKEAGVLVLNDPDGLARASNKLYLRHFTEEYRPHTLVTHQRKQLHKFFDEAPGPCVVKPLRGTRGDDVFKVEPDDPNLNQIVDVVLRKGYAMAQHFVPEAVQGDTRLVTIDGDLLEVRGKPLAVARVPGGKDFRSNVAAGGSARPAVTTQPMRDAVAAIGPQLRRDGIFLAGLDFIGGKVVEVNVYSTGGFHDAQEFYKAPFIERVLTRLDQRVKKHRRRIEEQEERRARRKLARENAERENAEREKRDRPPEDSP